MESLTGGAPSPGWKLYHISTYNIHGDTQEWFSGADVFGEFHIEVPGKDGHGEAKNFNNIYKSLGVLQNSNSGNLNLRMMIPATATELSFNLMDQDTVTANDVIASSHLPSTGCTAATCTVNLYNGMESYNCRGGFLGIGQTCDSRQKSQATLTYQVYEGAALEPGLLAAKAANAMITEPWDSLADPSSAGSYWKKIKYYGSQVGYIWNGMFGDTSGTPVSGLWSYLSEGSHSGGTMTNGPGEDTTSIIGWSLAKRTLENVGPALARHDRFRGNELGIQLLNDALWPEKPSKEGLSLGDDNYDHAALRPILDKFVGPEMASDPVIKDKVRQAAEKLVATNFLDTGTSIKKWTTILLHEFHLGMKLTDAEADEFVGKMGTFLYTSFLPKEMAISTLTSGLKTWKEGRLTAYKAALATHLHNWTAYTPQQQTAIASGTLDSLVFAGGVSVPTVLKNAFGILYGDYGASQLGANFQLKESQILPFVLETVRRFPPVAGFPSWDRKTNTHTAVNLLMSSADESPEAWGPTAKKFVMRPIKEYHDKSIAWADFALVNGDNGHPFSHACPAKDLSIMMVAEFLRVWVRQGGKQCWNSNVKSSAVIVNCYRTTVFNLTNTCQAPTPITCADPNSMSVCPQDNMELKDALCSDATEAIRIGKAPLPKQLRGIYWLSDQKDSSALMSFAQSNDGGGYSSGQITEKADGTGSYMVRVGGDKVWSFADRAGGFKLANLLDLVYHFEFDNATNPTKAQIFPAADNLMSLKVTATQLLDFRMTLEHGGEFPNSVWWGRDSFAVGQEMKDKAYKLIQIVDENGTKLSPAWDEFLGYCAHPVTGATPDHLHYREATPPPQIVASIAGLQRSTGQTTDAGLWNWLTSRVDSRFDTYTRIITMSINGQNWVKPTSLNVTVPTSKETVPLIKLPNVAGVEVPRNDEHWPDVSETAVLAQGLLTHLSFPDSADECGFWAADENPEATILKQIEKYPEHRVLVPWGADRMSDTALEDIIFYGIGQHRLQKVPPTDTWGAQIHGAYYAVYLNFASTLEVKSGFAKLGADAYFDATGKILGIVRNGRIWRPTDSLGKETTCTGYLWWKSCSYELGWRHAKLAFRGTLMAIITLIDHLYGLHFTIGNAIVTSNVRELDPAHPLRRLLTPFGFRTEAINFQAANVLTPEYHLVHRASALSNKGMHDAYAFANTTSRMMTWNTIVYKIKTRGDTVDTFTLPIDEDGTDYYAIINKYVKSYMQLHFDYAANTCGSDGSMVDWYIRANSVLPQMDLPMPMTCESVEEVVSMFMYLVSAMHQHVGTIGAEVKDPCFAPWAWREGELCGPPRTFYTHAAIMLSTAFEQPRILEDYTHMFDDAASKQLWRDLTTDLQGLGRTIADRNTRRRRPFKGFQVETMETGVSI